jgi:Mg2+ and Co2+ transporter CorA
MVEEKHPGPIAQDYQEHRFKADDYSEFSEVNTDSAERGIARRVYDLRYPTGANEPLLMKWGRAIKKRMKRRMRRDSDWITVSSMPEEVSLHKVIITQIAPRHTIDIDLDQAFQSQELTMSFDREINSTKSTLDGVCDKLERDGRPFNLSRSLFHIIRQDTLTLLKQLSHSLEEVEIGLLDDSKMEDQLSVWIQAIGCAQREISELQASVEPFIVFCISLDLPLNTGEENAVFRSELTCDLQKFSENITQMSDRLQRTSMLLTSNMGLLDSRRSISEAQAVSRLTELAFVFVPLSFATSVFGMQVKPLADPVPLRSFFIVAIVVTTFAYLMRATMRSQWLGYLKTLMRHDVRRYAKSHSLPVPTQSMPTLLTVQWIGSWLGVGIKAAIGSMRSTAVAVWSLCKEVWEVFGFVILFILLNGSISGLLIAILWAQRLDPSTRYAVSIAIIMIVIVGVGIPFWYWSDPDFRHALPNWIHDKMRFYQPSSNLRMVLTSSLIVVLMMIPLILIWMRPLANDIKSGLTAGILMSAISIMCLLICWWFKVDFPLAVSARMSRS